MKKTCLITMCLLTVNAYSQCKLGATAICETNAGVIQLTDLGLISYNNVGSPRCTLKVNLPNNDTPIAVVGIIDTAQNYVVSANDYHPIILIKYDNYRNYSAYKVNNQGITDNDISCEFSN